jgi:histidine ammonia-lyase
MWQCRRTVWRLAAMTEKTANIVAIEPIATAQGAIFMRR